MNAPNLPPDRPMASTDSELHHEDSTAEQDSSAITSEDILSHSSRTSGDPDRDQEIDLDKATANASKPVTDVQPNFNGMESEEQYDIKTQEPTPGYLQFPGAFDANGNRIPIKEMFERPNQEILPPVGEPLWKQMLSYCQRWGLWVSEVKDEKRRIELMDFVTKRMREAWEFGIVNGHCGEPNGHKYCCLSHNGDSRKHGKNSFPAKESRKRNIDVSKQPAPFACADEKYQLSILNRELEKEGTTMDAVLQRVVPEQLELGNARLKEICDVLGRRKLERRDWTALRWGNFNPLFHSRNLFMFSLWEYQRCTDTAQVLEEQLLKSTTENRRYKLQKRMRILQQRADQHLALAVEIDKRRGDEDGDQGADEDTDVAAGSDQEDVVVSTRPTRTQKPVNYAQAIGNEHGEHCDTESNGENSNRSSAQPESEPSHSPSDSPHMTQDPTGEPEHEINTSETEGFDDQVTKHEGIESHGEQTLQSEEQWDSSESAAAMQSDDGRSEFDSERSDDEAEEQIRDDTLSPTRIGYFMATQQSAEMTEPISEDVSYMQSLQHQSNNIQQSERYDDAARLARQQKQDYTTDVWQPQIDALLIEIGAAPMKWKLRGWTDIRYVLELIGYDPQERNQMLYEYKTRFAQWEHNVLRQQAHDPMGSPPESSRTKILIKVPEMDNESSDTGLKQTRLSDKALNSSRGFEFRYFADTTNDERSQIDDSIMEYIRFVMHARVARHGWYVVLTTGHPYDKPIAHGIWVLKGNKRMEDAEWFYKNEPVPVEFRAGQEQVSHDWGYSLAPLSPSKKRKRAQTVAKHEYDQDGFEYDSAAADADEDHPTTTSTHSSQGTKRQRRSGYPYTQVKKLSAKQSTRKRKGRRDDSENDDDYRPGSD